MIYNNVNRFIGLKWKSLCLAHRLNDMVFQNLQLLSST
jgi:hypothetical protein